MMLQLKNYSLSAIIVFSLALGVKNIMEELIPWQAGNKLTWNDYHGKPDPASDAAASTSTYLNVKYSFSNHSFQYKISCGFSKNRSWVRFKNDFILSHEQGHFDITEIFARRLNKALSEYRLNENSYRQDLNKIYQDITDDKDKMQDQYDEETDYSRNKEKQIEWLKKIEKMLRELKEFAGYN